MVKTSIEWAEETWSPVRGCKHGCPYCYVKRFDKQYNVPRFDEKALHEPEKRRKPTRYFVVPFGDLFGEWVPYKWIMDVLQVAYHTPRHVFMFLTKNPSRMDKFVFPHNAWVGTSVTCEGDKHRIDTLRNVPAGLHFVSFEPIRGHIQRPNLYDIEWAIVGAETISNASTPRNSEVSQQYAGPLIAYILESKVPLFIKPNLLWTPEYKDIPTVQESQGTLL